MSSSVWNKTNAPASHQKKDVQKSTQKPVQKPTASKKSDEKAVQAHSSQVQTREHKTENRADVLQAPSVSSKVTTVSIVK